MGNQHQAGSDSALTGLLFFRLKKDTLPKDLTPQIGKIYGLSGSFPVEKVFHLDNVVIREKCDESIMLKLSSALDNTPYNWESLAAYAGKTSSSSVSLETILGSPIYNGNRVLVHRYLS